jgi:hypothetical protein
MGVSSIFSSLKNDWRLPFERAFGQCFARVRLCRGRHVDYTLTRYAAVALTITPETILVSHHFDLLSEERKKLVIGHELVHCVQLHHHGMDAIAQLEAEAWQAAAAALSGYKYQIQGKACQPLAALALVENGDAARYFDRYPQILDLNVTQTLRIRPFHFERLMDLMLASDESDFVLECHGNPNGLKMPLRSGNTEFEVTRDNLNTLSRIQQVHQGIEQAGTNIDRWSRLMESIGQRLPDSEVPWTERIGRAGAGDEQRRIQEATDRAGNWLVRQTESIDLDKPRLYRYLDKMGRLHGRRIQRIQFCSCNIGDRLDTLQAMRRFFGAQRVGAPNVRSGFGIARVGVGRGSISALFRDHPQARAYGEPGQQFAIRIITQAGSSRARIFSAADNRAAIRAWISEHLMPGGRWRRRVFPVHWINTQPRAFPRDRSYRQTIRYSSELWYSHFP